MTHGVRVVAQPAAAAGFALAGLTPLEVADAAQGAGALGALVARPDVGIVLIFDGALRAAPDELRRRLARRPLPLVVPFPGAAWAEPEAAAEGYIVELLRQVIGYRVRFR